jgi:capsular polysaccharide biosynthesis protein
MSTDVAGNEPTLSLRDLLGVVWRRLWVVVLVASMLSGIAVGVSLAQTPTYATSIKILVGQDKDNADTSLGSDVEGLQQISQTMAQAVDTRPVAEAVIRRLNLQKSPGSLLDNMSAEQIGATQFIEVSYEDTSPEDAQRIANAIGEVFSEQVSEVSASANDITATVWERAVVPDSPVSPKPLRNGLLALALGVMLGIGLAFLLEHLDDRLRSPEEMEQISGVPTFGVIPTFRVPIDKVRGEKG